MEDEVKRFGKLSIDQIRQLIQFVPFLEQARPELAALMAAKPEKAAQFFKPGVAWGNAYDYPIEEQLALFLAVAGLTDFVVQAAKAPDPMAELAKLDDHPEYQEWAGGAGKQFEIHDLLGALYGLFGTFECLMLYGYYLNELLAIANSQGNDEALFNAIRVDPVAITSETAAHRISRAVVQADAKFFSGLQNALLGKTGKQARYLQKFKVLMQILLESGLLDRPNAEIRSLAFELDVYADNPGAEKNLNELIRKFRHKKTIPK
ncbi:hypothetical protein V8G57_15485 [Collimonas sp. H4R21]|uniref:Uncharacterized protein n=1 Tax=Collimonas rhizosphaerae TaxID=3126357 RepID=A0ABU9PXQ9_9BURK